MRYHFSLESKEGTCISILCERANSHGTCNFTGDADQYVEFCNDSFKLHRIIFLEASVLILNAKYSHWKYRKYILYISIFRD